MIPNTDFREHDRDARVAALLRQHQYDAASRIGRWLMRNEDNVLMAMYVVIILFFVWMTAWQA